MVGNLLKSNNGMRNWSMCFSRWPIEIVYLKCFSCNAKVLYVPTNSINCDNSIENVSHIFVTCLLSENDGNIFILLFIQIVLLNIFTLHFYKVINLTLKFILLYLFRVFSVFKMKNITQIMICFLID